MIAIFSGTKDGRILIEEFSKDEDLLVSVASEQGADLIVTQSKNKLIMSIGKKNITELIEVLIKEKIEAVIDATHPYAIEISKNLMIATEKSNILYLRYQREAADAKADHEYETYEAIIEDLNKRSGNIFITTGSNNLEKFMKIDDIKRLIVRVIPSSNILKKCEDLGLGLSQIIASVGPHSQESNELIIKEKKIKYLITKESGKIGGVDEKIQAARNQGIKVLALKAPKVEYRNVCTTIKELKEHLLKAKE